MCTGWPRWVPTSARPSAIVPEELSTIGAPGFSAPERRASVTTCRATRSFIAKLFASSSFAYTSTPSGAGTRNRTSGV